jgi:mRNA-degrading endonuclease toxin of MazEF toxin-antitoxin module
MNVADFSPGDIVLIEHRPLDDPSTVKARPAIVISSSAFNKGNLDVIVAAISSVIRHGDPKQVVIQNDDAEFALTGLKVTSAIKCGSLFAYPKSHIRRRLGRAPQDVLVQTRKLMIEFLTDD